MGTRTRSGYVNSEEDSETRRQSWRSLNETISGECQVTLRNTERKRERKRGWGRSRNSALSLAPVSTVPRGRMHRIGVARGTLRDGEEKKNGLPSRSIPPLDKYQRSSRPGSRLFREDKCSCQRELGCIAITFFKELMRRVSGKDKD